MRLLLLWTYLYWVSIGVVMGADTLRLTTHQSPTIRPTNTAASLSTTLTSLTSSSSLSSGDRDIIRILLVKEEDQSYYYFAHAMLGDQEVMLRLDILQADVWTMNANRLLGCDAFVDYYEEHQVTTSVLPDITTNGNTYDGSLCYYGGGYATVQSSNSSSSTAGAVEPTKVAAYNDEPVTVEYPALFSASGVIRTDNFSVMNDQHQMVLVPDFSFVLVDDSNLVTGSLGLMLHPSGSGFLDTLRDLHLIDASSYSLILGSNSSKSSRGFVLPGVVDQQYYEGDFYSFDRAPYTGLYDDVGNSVVMPAVEMDDIRIENANTKQSVSLKSDDNSIPLLLDSQSFYSYLPLNVLINIAMQVNAVYNPEIYRWIVECDSIEDSNANIQFVFGNLTISMDLREYLVEAYSNNSLLTFSNGKQACFLFLLPSSISGYNSLGITFIEKIYLAVDNEGGKIGMAKRNSELNLDLDGESYNNTSVLGEWGTTSSNITSHSTVDRTIAYIQSGSIPFATYINQTNRNTLTFGPSESVGPSSVPAKFSGTIRSGEVVVTGDYSNLGPSFTEAASAARENSTSTRSGANIISNPLAHSATGWSQLLMWSWALGSVGFLGMVMLW